MKTTIACAVLFIVSLHSISHAADRCSNFKIISHRGLSGLAPEESKFAFEMASALRTDFLEMDVHRTKDGILIVNHDNDFSRTTDIAKIYPNRVKDPVESFNYAEILKLETGSWFNQKFPEFANNDFIGARILKLEDVIDIALAATSRPGLYIETKSPELYPGVEKDIVALLEKKVGFKDLKIIFQSFDASSLVRFQELKPDVPRVYLSESIFADLAADLKIASQTGNGIGPDYAEMSGTRLGQFLNQAHALKLFVHFYTVNDAASFNRLITAGADGVFTNRTDLLSIACGRTKQEKIKSPNQKRAHP